MTGRNPNLKAVTRPVDAAGVPYTIIIHGKHQWIGAGHKRRAIEFLEQFAGERPLAVKAMIEMVHNGTLPQPRHLVGSRIDWIVRELDAAIDAPYREQQSKAVGW